MSNSYLEYKDYSGSIEPDISNDKLFGKVLFIRDLITYEGRTIKQLEDEFRFSVNAYLEDCKTLHKQPDKPFKGSFNIRTGPKLHRDAALAAKNQSLNSFVCDAIKAKLQSLDI